ncbi:hypothetical protein HHI36_004760 [Cryptolaemus montrouzieri]|uniref:Uncharacterized protein n=1 Tax=Cryptolaemus montrouzieri TaxID=559131 RepID=A0ABD2NSR5_9CUCU
MEIAQSVGEKDDLIENNKSLNLQDTQKGTSNSQNEYFLKVVTDRGNIITVKKSTLLVVWTKISTKVSSNRWNSFKNTLKNPQKHDKRNRVTRQTRNWNNRKHNERHN